MLHEQEPENLDITPTREGYSRMLGLVVEGYMSNHTAGHKALKELVKLAAGADFNGESIAAGADQ